MAQERFLDRLFYILTVRPLHKCTHLSENTQNYTLKGVNLIVCKLYFNFLMVKNTFQKLPVHMQIYVFICASFSGFVLQKKVTV